MIPLLAAALSIEHEPGMIPSDTRIPQPRNRPDRPSGTTRIFLLFVCLCFPCLFVAVVLVRGIRRRCMLGLAFQGCCCRRLRLVRSRLRRRCTRCCGCAIEQPFWRSLGWRPISFSAAVVRACSPGRCWRSSHRSAWARVLHTPEIDLPFQQMLDDRRPPLFCSASWSSFSARCAKNWPFADS